MSTPLVPASLQQLINMAADAATLEAVINGTSAQSPVTSRLGGQLMTLAAALELVLATSTGVITDTVTGVQYTLGAVNGVISLVPVAGQGTPVTGLVSHLTFSDTVTNNIYQVSIVNGAYTPVEVVAGTVLSVPFVLVDTATSVHYQLKFVNGALQPVVSSSVVNALNAITMVDQDTNAHFTLAMTNGAFTINPA